MATSEIEKLERRYAENPHGLTFAPLAEVHRKNGDVTRALELLRIGLELHPNYIPASIVLGRCHQDLGDLAGAEAAFAHVLRLDDENVIALKSLADINERQERLEEAQRWLQRLVTVDRSNDEARQQLQRIEEARKKTQEGIPEATHATALDEVPPPPPPAPEQPEVISLELTADVDKPSAPMPLEPAALQDGRVASEPPPNVEKEPEPPVPIKTAVPLAGLETAEFEPPKGPVGSPLGLEIETESDVVLNSSGASEFSVPDASQDFAALAAKMNASRPRNPGRRASDRAPTEMREMTPKPPPEPPQPPMAPSPAMAPPPAPPLPAPAPTYSARDTKGQSVAAFFQELLAARPPAQANSREGSTAPGPEDGRVSPAPSTGGQNGELMSFDDFFGSPAEGNAVGPGGEPGKDDLDQFQSWLQNLKR